MRKLHEIFNLPNNDDFNSNDCILQWKSSSNIQQLTKTPVKCHLCKETIYPTSMYRTFSAIYIKRTRGKMTTKSRSRKTCGSCDGTKEAIDAWNQMVDAAKQKGGE